MTEFVKDRKLSEASSFASEKLDIKRKHPWQKHIKIRAYKIKKQLQIENRFHKAMTEMRSTTDQNRRSYLHWILEHMFSVFDYETALYAINDHASYKSWLAENRLETNNNH